MNFFKLAILVTIFFLSACESDKDNENNSTQATLDTHRQLWESHNINEYIFDSFQSCNCLPEWVYHSFSVNGSNIQKYNRYLMQYENSKGLDFGRLFDLIQENIGVAESIEVEYDETYGYPTKIFIDKDSMIADEEIIYTISNVEFPPESCPPVESVWLITPFQFNVSSDNTEKLTCKSTVQATDSDGNIIVSSPPESVCNDNLPIPVSLEPTNEVWSITVSAEGYEAASFVDVEVFMGYCHLRVLSKLVTLTAVK